MSIATDLSKITLKDLSLGLLSLLFLVTPGFLTFFVFDKELFLKLDVIKLVILSLSTITPFIILNFFFLQQTEDPKNLKISSSTYLVLAIFISVLIIDLSLFIKFIFNYHVAVFIILTILIQVIAFLILYLVQKSSKHTS